MLLRATRFGDLRAVELMMEHKHFGFRRGTRPKQPDEGAPNLPEEDRSSTECPSGLEIDEQLELGRALNRDRIQMFNASKDTAPMPNIRTTNAIGSSS
jgi:hypothetical protein